MHPGVRKHLPVTEPGAFYLPNNGVFFMDNSKTVLVVDDDKDIVKAVETILTMYGYNVVCAYTGKESLEVLKHNNPDLMLLDLMLPDLNGKQVADAVRKDLDSHKLPIVVISAAKEARETCKTMDVQDCLEKPFEMQELVATVSHYTEKNPSS